MSSNKSENKMLFPEKWKKENLNVDFLIIIPNHQNKHKHTNGILNTKQEITNTSIHCLLPELQRAETRPVHSSTPKYDGN